jgi:hypothetical protein
MPQDLLATAPSARFAAWFPHVVHLVRCLVLGALVGPLTGCVGISFGGQGAGHAGSDPSSAPAFARFEVGDDNGLVGRIAWTGHKHDMIIAQQITVHLLGPGSNGAARPANCSIQACQIGGESAWSLEGLSEGSYAVEVRHEKILLAHVELRLASVPTVGGKTILAPELGEHAGRLETVFTERRLWLARDKRQSDRAVSLVWFHEGTFVGATRETVHGPGLTGPLLDFATLVAHQPALARGLQAQGAWELMAIWNDTNAVAGYFKLTVAGPTHRNLAVEGKQSASARRAQEAAEPPPWSFVLASDPPDDRVKAALANLPKGPPAAKPHSEGWACAVSLDPAAGPVVTHILAIKKEIARMEARATGPGASAQFAVEDRAKREGREVTSEERNAVDSINEAGLRAASPAVAKLYAALKAAQGQLDDLGSKQKPGCMKKGLPAPFRDTAEGKGAPFSHLSG